MAILTKDTEIRERLLAATSVAVLGAHTSMERPAGFVPAYLHEQGLEVWSVNPTKVGQKGVGHDVVGTLQEVRSPVDVVVVFRRSELLMGHLNDILAMQPRPPLVWLQRGIEHAEFAAALVEHGIDVVQDRCALAEHKRWTQDRQSR